MTATDAAAVPAAPPFRPDPELITNSEGDKDALRRTQDAAHAAVQEADQLAKSNGRGA